MADNRKSLMGYDDKVQTFHTRGRVSRSIQSSTGTEYYLKRKVFSVGWNWTLHEGADDKAPAIFEVKKGASLGRSSITIGSTNASDNTTVTLLSPSWLSLGRAFEFGGKQYLWKKTQFGFFCKVRFSLIEADQKDLPYERMIVLADHTIRRMGTSGATTIYQSGEELPAMIILLSALAVEEVQRRRHRSASASGGAVSSA